MGSGKGYLTFALYDYLHHTLQRQAHITGIEMRTELIELCNNIAQSIGFSNLQFKHGTIESFDQTPLDVLMALHACNTATDEAIGKGLQSNAHMIIVAPCCHKEIRKQMEKNKTPVGCFFRHAAWYFSRTTGGNDHRCHPGFSARKLRLQSEGAGIYF